MAWTNVLDANLLPDKAGRSADIIAIKDNIPALANGDAGAPKIQTAAIADLSITSPKIVDGNVTNAKLEPSERMNTTNVGAATAGLSAAAIGSYAFCNYLSATTITAGSTTSGSLLDYASADSATGVNVGVGTWLCLGHADGAAANGSANTLFLRIA